MDITKIQLISTGLVKKRFRKLTALIPIKLSRPNSKVEHVTIVACP